METYRHAIGIAGTHGKTTCTSIIAVMMYRANLDPAILVGGELDEIGGNVHTGKTKSLLLNPVNMDSFLKFYPKIAIILNIEKSFGLFKDINHIYSSF